MVIALPALWMVAASLAFYLAAKLILTPAIIGILRHIPAIGRFLQSGANAIVTTVENAIGRWVAPHLATIVRWLKALAIASVSPALALVYGFGKLDDVFRYLRNHTIPAMIHAITNPIVRAVNDTIKHVNTLRHDLTDFEREARRSISQGIRDLRTELEGKFARGIDRLRNDVFERALPAVEADIGRLARGIEAEFGTVEKDATALARRVADLAKRLDLPLSTIEALIAAVGITAAVEALETLGRCSPKLRTLCTSDPFLWEQFVLGALFALEFPGLRSMCLMGVSLVEDVSGAIVELAES